MCEDSVKIVCIGGGTGLSTMIRGLKHYTDQLTAVVTVADNGGGSGILRREMNMPPPGDVRNCLLALAETESILEHVFQYRFKDGCMKGQNLGNLFLAALYDMYGGFDVAVEKATEVLAVKGKVLPVTIEDIHLAATYEDGSEIVGEHEIVFVNKIERKRIAEVRLLPGKPKAYRKALEALEEADLIVLGPGSLFTSIIPNLLVEGVCQTIRKGKALVVYVSNIMTQPGETDRYTLKNHVEAMEAYLGTGAIHAVVVNGEPIPEEYLRLYEEDGCTSVEMDLEEGNGMRIVSAPLLQISHEKRHIRHDPEELAKVILRVFKENQERNG
ncbi:YvcK family protein [Clostridiales bacterium F-3ap]|uniref:Putative gluconeogenesis factor n=2 Tax=Anaerotalea alkaliphila TaxID=2662126 RepID=A0A7X5KLX7_9FIRM|nr:YvcK family protein [Anaerotalea alkaliphila]